MKNTFFFFIFYPTPWKIPANNSDHNLKKEANKEILIELFIERVLDVFYRCDIHVIITA
jgi:hypothetical protein